MAVLRANRVSKSYDRVTDVLKEVSLTVERGEVLVLMGRSGSGKTTLLNLLAGLDRPTGGSIVVDGVNVGKLDEEARTRHRLENVGVVFQRFHLIPELTVLENVRLPMRMAGRDDASSRAEELLAYFGLEDHADAFPATLSGGETQRAAMARALGNEPGVVLADEPTANLDEDNALNALAALRQVAEDLGAGVLIATHDPLARDAGDRVLHLVDGRIQQTGEVSPARPPGAGEAPTPDPGSSG